MLRPEPSGAFRADDERLALEIVGTLKGGQRFAGAGLEFRRHVGVLVVPLLVGPKERFVLPGPVRSLRAVKKNRRRGADLLGAVVAADQDARDLRSRIGLDLPLHGLIG